MKHRALFPFPGKAGLTVLALAGLTASPLVLANPQGGSVTLGSGSITINGSQTTIDQSSDRLAIDWDAFNIPENSTVTFNQPGSTSVALNRDFSGSPSQIFGDLTANGQVFLLNTAGVLIGSSGTINTGGLLISDMQASLSDFADGDLTLSASQRGGIINEGALSAGEGGLHLVAGFIDNNGRIETSGGPLGLTVADSVTVRLGDSGLMGVSLSAPLDSAPSGRSHLINNRSEGEIVAMGGDIFVQARYYDDLAVAAVNNDGLINALAINQEGGRIFLTNEAVSRPASASPEDPVLSESGEESVRSLEDPGEGGREEVVRLDDVVADCVPEVDQAKDCVRENAIKRYLGRLLVNGRL